MESTSVLFGVLLWPLILTIFGPVLLFLFLTRLIIIIFARLNDSSLMPLPFFDQMHICSEGILFVVVGVMRLKDKISVEDFRQKFQESILVDSESIFDKEVVTFFGYGFTRKVDQLNLKYHIREVIPLPEENFDQIYNNLSNDNTAVEKKGVSQWEVVVVNGIQGSNDCMVFIKYHHALADGYSLVKMFDTLTDNKSQTVNQDKWNCTMLKRIKIILKSPYELLRHTILTNSDLVQDLFSSLRDQDSTSKGWAEANQGEFNSSTKLNMKRRILTSTTTISLKKIKSIRSHTGCRVMPILTCIQVEALKVFLQDLRGGSTGTHIPYYRPFYPLPIPRHPAATSSNKFCNHWIPGTARVNLNNCNLIDRLKCANESFGLWESNDMHKIMSALRNIAYILPIWVLAHVTYLGNYPHYSSLTSMLCSNKPYKLLGVDVENLFCGVTHHAASGFQGILTVTLTRGDELDVCIRGTTDLFHNQEEIDVYTKNYFQQVLDLYYSLSQQI